MKFRLTACAAIVVLATVLVSSHAQPEALIVEGKAKIVDGMTLEIWGKRIRLAGIAVAEINSDEGRAAKVYLKELVAEVAVRCVTMEANYRSRTPGNCFVGKVDIGDSLVKSGHARRIVQQSLGP